jgi:hypothetical protein
MTYIPKHIADLQTELADTKVKYQLVMQFLKASAPVLLYYDTEAKLAGRRGLLEFLPDAVIKEMFDYSNMEEYEDE